MNGRKLCQIALAFTALAATVASTSALAGGHGGYYHSRARVGVGVYVGPGWGWGPGWGPGWGYPYGYGPYYPGYGYYPAPAVVTVPANPPQYIEQGSDGNPALTDGSSPNAWWYHCDQPEGYYPYVKNCPGGWQRVPAQPPSS
ncbi:hypothetical protein SAMN05216345_102419 [Cupriavidus sp. YR651]|uniref:hypothetical protein n=1 Tax=Cupriavidus sp. YR651 TaxID=1855315 RepID=UPI00088D601B|nr:hypothetical protein [Cupriavidus sp. YR651]SDC46881.1 hypothetical protein SAMN05216345_102419 [Cupriavidus sp. YR651]